MYKFFALLLLGFCLTGCNGTAELVQSEAAEIAIKKIEKIKTAAINPEQPKPQKPAPIIAKGIYLTGYSVSATSSIEKFIELIEATELNTVVFDIKDATGFIQYDSQIPLVDEINADKDGRIDYLAGVIDLFHQHGIYVIARQVVFQDPVLSRAKPEWSINDIGGGLWRDWKGQTWVDPTVQEVWEYNMAITKEVIAAGADEINFDYIRFPSDGPINRVVYNNLNGRKRYQAMEEYFEYLDDNLMEEPAYIGVDFFGLTLDNVPTGFDLNIGQRIIDARDHVHYIYPMTYPSHYPSGYAGVANPAASPYFIVSNSYAHNDDVLATSTTQFRTWIQAFNLGAVYDGAMIRAQITATDEASSTAGWILWNARNFYTSKGLKAAE